jgi:hypothetical protein
LIDIKKINDQINFMIKKSFEQWLHNN